MSVNSDTSSEQSVHEAAGPGEQLFAADCRTLLLHRTNDAALPQHLAVYAASSAFARRLIFASALEEIAMGKVEKAITLAVFAGADAGVVETMLSIRSCKIFGASSEYASVLTMLLTSTTKSEVQARAHFYVNHFTGLREFQKAAAIYVAFGESIMAVQLLFSKGCYVDAIMLARTTLPQHHPFLVNLSRLYANTLACQGRYVEAVFAALGNGDCDLALNFAKQRRLAETSPLSSAGSSWSEIRFVPSQTCK